jgi:hypothetical protein
VIDTFTWSSQLRNFGRHAARNGVPSIQIHCLLFACFLLALAISAPTSPEQFSEPTSPEQW